VVGGWKSPWSSWTGHAFWWSGRRRWHGDYGKWRCALRRAVTGMAGVSCLRPSP